MLSLSGEGHIASIMDLVLARHRGHHRLAPIAPDGLSDDGPNRPVSDRPIRVFVPNLVKNLSDCDREVV